MSEVAASATKANRKDPAWLRWAWEKGELSWKLHDSQLDLYEKQLAQEPQTIRVEVCHRRIGKSFEKFTLIEEIARRFPGSVQRYAAPKQNQANEIVTATWPKVRADCPKDLLPTHDSRDDAWVWANGSRLYIRGTDDDPERHRGSGCDWFHIDEAGFHRKLDALVDDVLGPMLDDSEGRGILTTTPPKSLRHPFIKFFKQAQLDGLLTVKPLTDSLKPCGCGTCRGRPRYYGEKLRRLAKRANRGATSEELDETIEALLAGEFKGSPAWKREYGCMMVTDDSRRITPEFSRTRHVPREMPPRPRHFTPYVSVDLAYARDFTAALFAYFDFSNSRVVIESEWVKRRQRADVIARSLRAREQELWGPRADPRRFGDNQPNYLYLEIVRHGYRIIPTRKDNLEGAVNKVRELLADGRIVISPACVQLISQLENGIWKDTGKRPEFESDDEGHLDALAAIVYLCRNVNWRLNPTPGPTFNRAAQHVNTWALERSQSSESNALFGLLPQRVPA